MSKYDELLTRLDHWSGFVTKNYADAAAAIRAQAKRIKELSEELAEALSVAREQGAADEREACAKIAENIGIRSDDPYASGEEIAEKIRARKGTGHES